MQFRFTSGIFRESKYDKEPTMIFLDDYYLDAAQNLITAVTIVMAGLGLVFNLLVLLFFYNVIEMKRIQSTLWSNLAVCYLVKCLAMLYGCWGDLDNNLSNTENKCRVRYALPVSTDLVCINCFLSIVFERIVALHCPAFYSILPIHGVLMHSFCWVYGISYFLFIILQLQTYDCPIECKTPYTHLTPVDPVLLVSLLTTAVLILTCVCSMLLLHPANCSNVEKIRLEMEVNGTYLVIAAGTVVLVLWIPKQIILILYWVGEIELAKYTVYTRIAVLALDSSVLLPFLAMLSTHEFRIALYCMFTMSSLRPIERKMMAQENYKNTIRKLVETEMKASSHTKNRLQITSISNRSTSTAYVDRSALDIQPSLIALELQPRTDYLIGQDFSVSQVVDT